MTVRPDAASSEVPFASGGPGHDTLRPRPTTIAVDPSASSRPSVSARIPPSLRSSTTRSFGHLIPTSRAADAAHASSAARPDGDRAEVPVRDVEGKAQQHAAEERAARGRLPPPIEPPSAASLEVRDDDGPVRGAVAGRSERPVVRRVRRLEAMELEA